MFNNVKSNTSYFLKYVNENEIESNIIENI